MMDFMFLASSFNTWAGPNNSLLDLCNYLNRASGIDLKLVTQAAPFDNDFRRWIGFPILPVLKGGLSDSKSRLVYAPLNERIIRKLLRSLKVPTDRIFVNASLDTLFEVVCATKKRIAIGYNVLGNDPGSAFFNLLDRFAAKSSVRGILAHTNYQKDLYMRKGIPEAKIRIIPHCVSVDRVMTMSSQSARTSERPTIFYGGRLVAEKGVRELLTSYCEISRRIESDLILVGKGPLEELIMKKRRTMAENGERGKIECLGWQPMTVFLSKMREADVVVVPSYDEPFGIILLEAMALKKPIIATLSGGVCEIVTNNDNAILVAPHKVEELTQAIAQLLSDSKMRNRIGSNAFRTVRQTYDACKVAPQFMAFMEECN